MNKIKKGIKSLLITTAIVVSLLGAQTQKAEAYFIVSVLMADWNHLKPEMNQDAKGYCAAFFFICVPYLVLGDSKNGSSLYQMDETWLNDHSYSDEDRSIILNDLKHLKTQNKLIKFEKKDTPESFRKALKEVYPQISKTTTKAVGNFLGVSHTDNSI